MRSKFKWIFTLLLAFTMQFSFAQQKTVTGTVTDGSGNSVAGANVSVKGTSKKVQTGFDGKYSIVANTGDVLVISFVGMQEMRRTVGSSSSINLQMQPAGEKLTEVVVVGYKSVGKKQAVTASAGITSKTLENRPNGNIINSVQGQLAGVNITATTGQPGAKSTVIIRGVGTINGNTDPLYVIDGFPSNSDNFRSINGNDIASFDVLKDAAAISQYGSRGSNGVIVIKTRKGNFGDAKTTFRYSSQYGVNQLQNPRYSYANSRELLGIEKTFGSGLGSTLTQAQINSFDINTNWVDYFFRQGTSVEHNLSVENNAKNLNSFTSASYFKQDGILDTTGLTRFTVRNNLNGKSADEKFKYAVNTAFGHSANNEATNLGGGAINRNYVLGAFLSVPYISPNVYQNSFQAYNVYQNDGTLLYTPLLLIDKLKQYENKTEETRIDVATELSYKINENFTARTRTSGQLLSTRFFQSEFPNSINGLLFSSTPGIPSTQGGNFNGFEDINQRREFLFNNLFQLEFNKVIGKHTFDASVSSEYNHSRLNVNNFRQRGLDPKTFIPNTGAGYIGDVAANDFYVPTVVASQLRNDLISYFAVAEYDYDKKYGIVGTVRRDGSSRFIGEKQFGNFWSVGARWNIDEEAFMDSLEFVNVLKVRGSIGTVGNQRLVDGTIYAGINPPAFADIYSVANNAYNSGIGYNINIGYPDLRWETTEQYNAGLDFEFFNSRLRGSFDYYNKKTIDLFLSEPISPSAGTTSILKNSDATVTNKGYELAVAYDIIKNADMKLTIRANGSQNDNRIGGIKANNGKIFSTGTPVFVNQNGGMINEPFVYPYLGVNPANGNLLFQDINGNPTETPVAADRVASGKNNLPVYQGGFGFDFEYKGFYTSTLFTYAQKVWRFDFDLDNLYDTSNIGTFVVTNDLANAWTPSNAQSNVPSLTAANYGAQDNSDRFLRDASYVRLRNIQIGYRIPKRFLDNTFFKDVSFNLQGENLFNITKWQGFDPESSRTSDVYQYPTPRIYTFGVDIKF